MTNTYDMVGNTIRAIGTDAFYQALYSVLEEAFDFDNFLVIGYHGESRPLVLNRTSRSNKVHADLESQYVPSLYVLDPFYSAHLNKVSPGAYRLRDIAPDKFNTTSYFNEYYKKTSIVDEIAFIAYVKNGWTINVCVGRDETSSSLFGKGALKKANELAQCICSLLELHFDLLRLNFEEEFPNLDNMLVVKLKKCHAVSITPRQAQVAVLLLRGHSSKSIAKEMGISWQTVRVFRKQLYARCNVSSQAELFALLTPLIAA
ncbi:helix-turn-helix transcriptional regulator [Leucothrix mucor]|uniref:helix-turn-helix transcriptional regulator n=1 Tax=Leucothrix mucor TaxID=45248 RepID=UPI0003B5FE22|nr:helix-turn-helix transcriptional regulator [Leucothrix mucor]